MKKGTKKYKERKKRSRRLARELEKLYNEKSRTALHYKTPWQLLVATILSAQCTDKRVNIVTKDLFKKYTDVDDYVKMKQSTLETLIHSTGFYKNKAKSIKGAAKKIVEDYKGEVPDSMEELVTLPGVARKTANVVLGNAFGKVEGIAVDTHVKRLSRKFGLTDEKDPKKIERDLMELLPKERWFTFSNQLIFFGRDYCSARKHSCEEHPLADVYPQSTAH